MYNVCVYIYIYIYIYIYSRRETRGGGSTANLRSKILDFGGFDSRILILRGGILMSIGNPLQISSQGILVGIILVRRLGVGVNQGGCCRSMAKGAARSVVVGRVFFSAPCTDRRWLPDRVRPTGFSPQCHKSHTYFATFCLSAHILPQMPYILPYSAYI